MTFITFSDNNVPVGLIHALINEIELVAQIEQKLFKGSRDVTDWASVYQPEIPKDYSYIDYIINAQIDENLADSFISYIRNFADKKQADYRTLENLGKLEYDKCK